MYKVSVLGVLSINLSKPFISNIRLDSPPDKYTTSFRCHTFSLKLCVIYKGYCLLSLDLLKLLQLVNVELDSRTSSLQIWFLSTALLLTSILALP